MVLPILFSRLIIKGEKGSLQMIRKLMDEPELGLGVCELHIMSELNEDIQLDQNQFLDTITGLKSNTFTVG
ncbi:hypothetical protein CPB84DRAFT_1768562 [Gymnopilus junonius]|uniref:Uncharacterized protein n=1 Tax=Gymnopilus junonius TaxID=109634 RepID=A0A9P5TRY2_GYMJU|nr:hypothetical protein CPB84DRAFT_1768562 [Gymnopilus junonius]